MNHLKRVHKHRKLLILKMDTRGRVKTHIMLSPDTRLATDRGGQGEVPRRRGQGSNLQSSMRDVVSSREAASTLAQTPPTAHLSAWISGLSWISHKWLFGFLLFCFLSFSHLLMNWGWPWFDRDRAEVSLPSDSASAVNENQVGTVSFCPCRSSHLLFHPAQCPGGLTRESLALVSH